MSRLNDAITRLKTLRKTLRSRDSLMAIDCALNELENGFNPSDGIWIVQQNAHSLSRFAKLSDLPKLDTETLAKLETRRDAASKALTETVEKTKRKMPGGETWWTYSPGEIIDEVFRAIASKEENEVKF